MDNFELFIVDEFNNAFQGDGQTIERNERINKLLAKHHVGVWFDPEHSVRYFVPHQGKLYYLTSHDNQTFSIERVFVHKL